MILTIFSNLLQIALPGLVNSCRNTATMKPVSCQESTASSRQSFTLAETCHLLSSTAGQDIHSTLMTLFNKKHSTGKLQYFGMRQHLQRSSFSKVFKIFWLVKQNISNLIKKFNCSVPLKIQI